MSAIKGSKELNKEAAEADGEPLALETESITPEDGTDVESDAGKLRQLLGVLKKVVGVKVSSTPAPCLSVSLALPHRAALTSPRIPSVLTLLSHRTLTARTRCWATCSSWAAGGNQDLANLRLSLPANLMEPQGNLEYWHYLDRPDCRWKRLDSACSS